jgi:hypothetical protein
MDQGCLAVNLDYKIKHINRPTQFSFGALCCVIAVAIVLGGLIIYPSEIKDAIWLMQRDDSDSISIPYFSVKLHNDGNESISLPLQGECFLWPPEHSWDFECGYEFKQADGASIDSNLITVPAKAKKDYLIHVTKLTPIHQTETSLARFLSAGDWYIQFITVTDQDGRTKIGTKRIPFTAEAMSSVYLFDVYRKSYRHESLNQRSG